MRRPKTALLSALFLGSLLQAFPKIEPKLEFDVASIKPARDFPGQRFRNPPGSLEVLQMQPTTLIRNAYHLAMEGQITGFPSWANNDTFDIEAKADEDPAINLAAARERNLLCLQALLVSRFQLQSHWESRIQRGYLLTVAKKGPLLKRSEAGAAHSTRQGRGTLFCMSCSISSLATFLSNFVQMPVQDETGIQGFYNFQFTFEPLDADASSDSGLPSLFTVLREQLGLKLEPRKIAVQTMVVDHIEHPSSN